MGEDPRAIREEIEDTRERMGDTVDALGYKADVPARAKDSLSERVEGVRAKLTGASAQVSEATPGTEDLARAGQQAVGIAQENPLGLAIGAAAVGFLAGMLVPSTRVEDERLGPVADQVKEVVAGLPVDERRAIELAYFGGHTYRQVAVLLDAPEGTVKSRIRSGLRRLRKDLAEAGVGMTWAES